MSYLLRSSAVSAKIRVGVLFGGQSGEHEVSLVSARAVIDGLDREHYEVVPIGITKQGRWIAGGNALPTLEAMADPKLLPGGPAQNSEFRSQNSEDIEDSGENALSVV